MCAIQLTQCQFHACRPEPGPTHSCHRSPGGGDGRHAAARPCVRAHTASSGAGTRTLPPTAPTDATGRQGAHAARGAGRPPRQPLPCARPLPERASPCSRVTWRCRVCFRLAGAKMHPARARSAGQLWPWPWPRPQLWLWLWLWPNLGPRAAQPESRKAESRKPKALCGLGVALVAQRACERDTQFHSCHQALPPFLSHALKAAVATEDRPCVRATALLCLPCLAPPRCSLAQVLRHAEPLGMHDPEVVLGTSVPLVRGHAVPPGGLREKPACATYGSKNLGLSILHSFIKNDDNVR